MSVTGAGAHFPNRFDCIFGEISSRPIVTRVTHFHQANYINALAVSVLPLFEPAKPITLGGFFVTLGGFFNDIG
jgi:hypothetical protein